MRLYEGSVSEFHRDVTQSRIADKLATAFRDYYRRAAAKGEVGAWEQSFNFLSDSLAATGLDDNRIIIEYELPYSSRRIDALLIGQDQERRDGFV